MYGCNLVTNVYLHNAHIWVHGSPWYGNLKISKAPVLDMLTSILYSTKDYFQRYKMVEMENKNKPAILCIACHFLKQTDTSLKLSIPDWEFVWKIWEKNMPVPLKTFEFMSRSTLAGMISIMCITNCLLQQRCWDYEQQPAACRTCQHWLTMTGNKRKNFPFNF